MKKATTALKIFDFYSFENFDYSNYYGIMVFCNFCG